VGSSGPEKRLDLLSRKPSPLRLGLLQLLHLGLDRVIVDQVVADSGVENLAEPRQRRGATQEGLAYEAGITTGTLSQLERGISNPAWGTLKAIAKALGVSMVELTKLTAKFEQ